MKYLFSLFACCDLITGLEFPYKFIAAIKAMSIQAETEAPQECVDSAIQHAFGRPADSTRCCLIIRSEANLF